MTSFGTSIIVPVLNEEKYLQRLLEYLSEIKSDQILEIIVCDGGSTDNTPRIARSFDVKWLESPRGRAKQQNVGASVAKGEILYFVHADTLPPDSFVQDIQNGLNLGYEIGGYRFRFQGNKKMLRFNSYMTRFNIQSFRGGDQTIFITKSLWKKLNGFDEKYVIMEEYDLLRRASSLDYKYHLMNGEVLVSDRKYDRNSWWRVNWANTVAMFMFKMQVDPAKIKKTYSKILKYRSVNYH